MSVYSWVSPATAAARFCRLDPIRQAGGGIAHDLEELEMPVRMTGLAFGGRAEQRSDIVLTFDVGLVAKYR